MLVRTRRRCRRRARPVHSRPLFQKNATVPPGASAAATRVVAVVAVHPVPRLRGVHQRNAVGRRRPRLEQRLLDVDALGAQDRGHLRARLQARARRGRVRRIPPSPCPVPAPISSARSPACSPPNSMIVSNSASGYDGRNASYCSAISPNTRRCSRSGPLTRRACQPRSPRAEELREAGRGRRRRAAVATTRATHRRRRRASGRVHRAAGSAHHRGRDPALIVRVEAELFAHRAARRPRRRPRPAPRARRASCRRRRPSTRAAPCGTGVR